MSNEANITDPSAPIPDLATLRAEIDGIDDALLDLLRQRAGVVRRMAASRVKDGAVYRPDREEAILRRLLGRDAGGLPPATVTRIWREIFAGSIALQGEMRAAGGAGAEAGSSGAIRGGDGAAGI